MVRFGIRGQSIDFENQGYENRLTCGERGEAEAICGLKIHAYGDEVHIKNVADQEDYKKFDQHGRSLHVHLYDRPNPVDDAQMLTRSRKMRVYLSLAVLAGTAALAGNAVTFSLYGYGILVTTLLAICATALPAVVGHVAFEKILAHNLRLQKVVATAAIALCLIGLFLLGQARLQMVDKATASSGPNSFVNDPAQLPNDPDQSTEDSDEARVRERFGQAMLLIAMGADVILGFLVGLLADMHADQDFTAWCELGQISKCMVEIQKQISERTASVEIAKKLCMAGILRAEHQLNRRQPAYHAVAFTIVMLVAAGTATAQKADRYESVLIDTSASIARGQANSDLFQEYLRSAKGLLLTVPANSEVWVSVISTDSFGGVHELLKGWTPEARGVFTGDLNRARHELASSFIERSSVLSPRASGTDIFGALWHVKSLFDSRVATGNIPKAIWIFSDMMNETSSFPMPELLQHGPEQMLDQAKAGGLLVPLRGYEIHVQGASSSGLTPRQWLTIQKFWTMYFAAVGAKVISYSAECDGLFRAGDQHWQ